jgi:hypothetical protein
MKQPPEDFEDDDRVVCDMNVAGMPWHQDRGSRKVVSSRQDSRMRGDPITKPELRRYTWYAMLAGLAVVAVFSIVWILFTLFATQVWFR